MSDERASPPEPTPSAAERRWRRAEGRAVDELKSREDELTDAEIIEAFREIAILPPDEGEEEDEEEMTDEAIIHIVRGYLASRLLVVPRPRRIWSTRSPCPPRRRPPAGSDDDRRHRCG